MLRLTVLLTALILPILLVALSGCGSSTQHSEMQPMHNGNAADGMTDDDHGHAGHEENQEKIEANLAKLSAEEQESARAQKVCPVADGPLGSMGVPLKVEVKDQIVWVCCKACIDEVKEHPDKYLAKLKS